MSKIYGLFHIFQSCPEGQIGVFVRPGQDWALCFPSLLYTVKGCIRGKRFFIPLGLW